MTEAIPFKESLDFSISDEVRRKNYAIILWNFPVKDVHFDELYGSRGNDATITLMDGAVKKVEFKNRAPGANANIVALEQWNVKEAKKLGWTFDIKSDYVVFTWHGRVKACYLIAYGPPLSAWWGSNSANYKEIINRPTQLPNGTLYHSSYSPVPIKDLPQELIFRHEQFVTLSDYMRRFQP